MKKLLLFIYGLTFCLHTSYAQYLFKGFDINPGTANSTESTYWGVNNNQLYFLAKTAAEGSELFICDGTTAGTHILKDIWPGTGSSYPLNNTFFNKPSNGKMFYRANDSVHGYELWVSDGTTAGTQLIKDTRPGIQSGVPVGMYEYKGKMYFQANDGIPANNIELWISDGTASGTYMFSDLCHQPLNETSNPSYFREYNGKLYFQANDPAVLNKAQVWVSDGTVANTQVTNISRLFRPNNAVEYNGKLYFCNPDTPGQGLYSTDGTAAGTQFIKSLAIGPNSIMIGEFCSYNNRFYFTAYDSTHGYEIWVSDGTTSGTHMLKDINPGIATGTLSNPVVFNNKLYFGGKDTSATKTGEEVWVTDGTDTGTHLFLDTNPGIANGYPQYFTVFNNHLFFVANDATGRNLYISDGTAGGTHSIQPAWATKTNALSMPSGTGGIIECNNSLYFYANYDSIGAELWSITDTSTSVATHKITHSFTLYPNPNDGTFTIDVTYNFKNGTVSVYDIMGREIYHKPQIPNSKFQITIPEAKGIYLVKLQLDDAVMTKRVVVE